MVRPGTAGAVAGPRRAAVPARAVGRPVPLAVERDGGLRDALQARVLGVAAAAVVGVEAQLALVFVGRVAAEGPREESRVAAGDAEAVAAGDRGRGRRPRGRGRDDAREERGAHVRARRLGVEVGRVAPARVAVERAAEARADAPVLECDARKADLARDLGEAAGDAEAAVAGALNLVAVVGPLVIACEHVRVVDGARAVAPKGRLREHVAAEFS